MLDARAAQLADKDQIIGGLRAQLDLLLSEHGPAHLPRLEAPAPPPAPPAVIASKPVLEHPVEDTLRLLREKDEEIARLRFRISESSTGNAQLRLLRASNFLSDPANQFAVPPTTRPSSVVARPPWALAPASSFNPPGPRSTPSSSDAPTATDSQLHPAASGGPDLTLGPSNLAATTPFSLSAPPDAARPDAHVLLPHPRPRIHIDWSVAKRVHQARLDLGQ